MAGVRQEPPSRFVQTEMTKSRISLGMVLRGTMYLLSLNLLVFLRRQFGERVASDLCVACGFSWFCYWLYTAVRVRVFPLLPEPRLTLFFLYELSALTTFHLANIWLRRKGPAGIHTHATGRPWDFWRFLGLNDMTLQRYIQPIACLLVALGLTRMDRFLAYWIMVGSVAVFVEEQLARFQMRRRVLDVIDSRIESQTLYGRVQDRISPRPVAGKESPVIEITEPSRRRTGKLKNFTARLDPELRKMLEPTPETEKEKPK